MPSYIIKCAPDEDLYLEWSTVVEAPTAVGTRAEMLDHLTENTSETGIHAPEARLQRADTTGTSAFGRYGCPWGSDGMIYKQRGILPRRNMAEYARRLLADVDAEPDDLLEPLS